MFKLGCLLDAQEILVEPARAYIAKLSHGPHAFDENFMRCIVTCWADLVAIQEGCNAMGPVEAKAALKGAAREWLGPKPVADKVIAGDTAILALRAKADRAYARYNALCNAATCTADERENDRKGSEADRAWDEFSAAEFEMIGLPGNTPPEALAKLEIATKLMVDDYSGDVVRALRGDAEAFNKLHLRAMAIISAVRDIARMCDADPVAATIRCRENTSTRRR